METNIDPKKARESLDKALSKPEEEKVRQKFKCSHCGHNEYGQIISYDVKLAGRNLFAGFYYCLKCKIVFIDPDDFTKANNKNNKNKTINKKKPF